MSDSAIEVTYHVYRNLKDYAHRNHPFTASELRDQLGYGEESPEARRMHAVIQARKKDGIITVISQGRKRNQHLQVKTTRKKDLDRLMVRALNRKARNNSGSTQPNSKATSGATTTPKRVVYLEERVELLEKAETDRRKQIEGFTAELSSLKQEVHRLVELWS